MRCDALLVEGAGRFRWWFGPCPARLAGGGAQSAVLAPNARTGSWLQRPWPPWDLAAFFRAVFPATHDVVPPNAHPAICISSLFALVQVVSTFKRHSLHSAFSILHSPFSTTRPPHTDTTLCKFLHPCHYQLCTYATQTAIRSTINLIFGCAPTVPSLTTRSSTLSAAWTRPGPNS